MVTRAQLRTLGLADDGSTSAPPAGASSDASRRVYAVGHTVLGVRGRWMAAVLAFLFVGAKLVVETDGWRHHPTREQFERDRHRDATLT